MTSGAKWRIVARLRRERAPKDHDERTDRANVFVGDFVHTLDEKGRVVMPAAFRAPLAGGVVTAKGSDGCVTVFPTETFAALANEEMASMPRTRQARMLARSKYAAAAILNLDAQGRVLIKEDLRRYAEIFDEGEVIVTGMIDRIEVWNKDLFAAETASADAAYREMEDVPGF